MKALRKKCQDTGTLLILDEIQTGFGRTGTLWGFQQFHIVPDIVLLGKALGGGMPLGAFIADRKLMTRLTENPVLGHITTFGGHPVCCAAGMAAMKILLKENIIDKVQEKEDLFRQLLVHPEIKMVRTQGLLIALEFENHAFNKKIIDACLDASKSTGVLTDWFLFAPHCMRIAPPLNIPSREIRKACKKIVQAIDAGM
jgi:acetylornithine/succinyldiaminopimelate/putrescine aminotransferase